MVDTPTAVLLAAAGITSTAMIIKSFYQMLHYKTRHSVEIKMDDLRITIEGDITPDKANSIIQAISASRVLAADGIGGKASASS